MGFAKNFFRQDFSDIDRLLKIFHNGQIDQRYFSAPMDWFQTERTLKEKNDLYIKTAVELGDKAVQACLSNEEYLASAISAENINALIYISTTGMATPSIEAKLMNRLPFNPHTKRIPIWGLGCAGGTAGLARAHEFCEAYPDAAVLVLCIELCSLTFQYGDRSKSNLVGTSLFADGAACILVAGNESPLIKKSKRHSCPAVVETQSTLMPDSENVMGWDIRDKGLFVVFDRSIPQIVEKWLRPILDNFLRKNDVTSDMLRHFIAHPGGKKILEAYEKALNLRDGMTDEAKEVLRCYGNMSSPTVLFVLDRVMKKVNQPGDLGVAVSLGPGFSSEAVLLEWEAIS